MKYIFLFCAFFVLFGAGCPPQRYDDTAPRVESTFPEKDAMNVDPATRELKVIFSEPMLSNSWSWVKEDPSRFPAITGDPKFIDTETIILPVSLQPNTTYDFWLNSASHTNFKDQEGNILSPFRWTFTTGESINPSEVNP